MREYAGIRCQWAWDDPNEFANEDALTHVLVHVESLKAPEQDEVLR